MFRIEYENNEYIYREFYKYYLFRRPSVFAFWVILISTYFMQLATDKGNWELAYFFPMFMFMQIYIYRSKYKLAYKKACDLTGEPYTYTFLIDEEKINFLSTEGISLDISCDHIRSYAVYSDLLILFTYPGKFYILPMDSFAEGSPEDLVGMLAKMQIKGEKHAK